MILHGILSWSMFTVKFLQRQINIILRTSGPQDLRTSGPQAFRTSGPQDLRMLLSLSLSLSNVPTMHPHAYIDSLPHYPMPHSPKILQSINAPSYRPTAALPPYNTTIETLGDSRIRPNETPGDSHIRPNETLGDNACYASLLILYYLRTSGCCSLSLSLYHAYI